MITFGWIDEMCSWKQENFQYDEMTRCHLLQVIWMKSIGTSWGPLLLHNRYLRLWLLLDRSTKCVHEKQNFQNDEMTRCELLHVIWMESVAISWATTMCSWKNENFQNDGMWSAASYAAFRLLFTCACRITFALIIVDLFSSFGLKRTKKMKFVKRYQILDIFGRIRCNWWGTSTTTWSQ